MIRLNTDLGLRAEMQCVYQRQFTRKHPFLLKAMSLVCVLLAGCEIEPHNDAESNPSSDLSSDPTTNLSSGPSSDTPNLQVPANLFQIDGYDTVDVRQINLKTATTPGICTALDISGCTFADVNADVDADDDLVVEIPVHMQAEDYPNDGVLANAELRQRGATSRTFPQKSYRIKLDADIALWRNERRLQLNKHSTDLTRIRNKLSFDLMSNVPNLPSLRTQFVNLWIDDGQGPVDFGLFTHIEAVSKEFLKNRDWNKDDRIYKADQFTFSTLDLAALALDETGAPLNRSAFEERLSIKTGSDNHTPLINMLTAIHDPAQSFDSILDRYFDRNNVLAWVTVNFLLGQKDVTTHNFYLYNPDGTEKFYFLPWDYDATFFYEIEPPNSFATQALIARLFYGYARGANSVFLDNYFRLPGMNAAVVNAANELRAGALSNAEITERAARYASVVRPFVTQQPDLQYLPTIEADPVAIFDADSKRLAEHITTNHQTLQNGLGIPMPHTLEPPDRIADQMLFSWRPAYDVTGNSINYDLQIATDVGFAADTIVFDVTGIADNATQVQYSVAASNLPDGPLFYRVIARASSDPQRFWQVATNQLLIDGVIWYGVLGFEVNVAGQ